MIDVNNVNQCDKKNRITLTALISAHVTQKKTLSGLYNSLLNLIYYGLTCSTCRNVDSEINFNIRFMLFD